MKMGDIEEEASDHPVYSRFSSLLDVYRISFASNAQPYFEDVPKSVKLRYNRFNELRVAQKRNVYYNIMTRGLIIFATGIVFLVYRGHYYLYCSIIVVHLNLE